MTEPSKLIEAVQSGDLGMVREMLSKEPALANASTPKGLPVVMLALYYGHGEIAETLVEGGAALDIFGVAAMGKTARVRELLAAQPELVVSAFSVDGFQALGLACFFGRTEAVRVLVEAGAEVNSASRNPMQVKPLHSAVAGGHLAIARILLEHGADPNARQADEFTPLHGAAQNGQVEMIRLLLAHGADRAATSAQGKSILDYARKSGSAEAAGLLE